MRRWLDGDGTGGEFDRRNCAALVRARRDGHVGIAAVNVLRDVVENPHRAARAIRRADVQEGQEAVANRIRRRISGKADGAAGRKEDDYGAAWSDCACPAEILRAVVDRVRAGHLQNVRASDADGGNTERSGQSRRAVSAGNHCSSWRCDRSLSRRKKSLHTSSAANESRTDVAERWNDDRITEIIEIRGLVKNETVVLIRGDGGKCER